MKNICIVEGFDMVGKDTFIKTAFSDYKVWNPDFKPIDDALGRDKAWTIGLGVVDFLSKTYNGTDKIAINRGAASSYAYSVCRDDQDTIDNRVVEWYKNNEFYHNQVDHLLLRFSDIEVAKELYYESKLRRDVFNEVSAKLDKFDTFNEYWSEYIRHLEKFDEYYDKVGTQYIPVVVSRNMFCIKEPSHSYVVEVKVQ